MVGHTGVLPAAVKAVETVDACLGRMVEACSEPAALRRHRRPRQLRQMIEPYGSPHTAHTMNPVPLIVTADVGDLREGGTLADVAPTVLDLIAKDQPQEMTGSPLQRRG